MHPLLENYEKYYGKKEKPKKEELKGIANVSLSKEQIKDLETYLSPTSGTSGIASVTTSSNLITTSNSTVSITQKPKALQTYDVDSCKDEFLRVVEKIKQGDARVTCVTMNSELVSGFPTRLRQTLTFEVQL